MWNLSFVVVIWALWKERNRTCFDGKVSLIAAIATKARFNVANGATSVRIFWACLLSPKQLEGSSFLLVLGAL